MKSKRIKFLSCWIVIFLMLIFLETQVKAEDMTASISEKTKTSAQKESSLSYTAPKNLTGLKNGFYYLTAVDGVYCLDHSMALKKEIEIGKGIDVTDKSNEMNYIFGCQKPEKVAYEYKYNKSLIQNYLWKYDIFGYNSLTKAPTQNFKFESIKAANEAYENYENNILNADAYTQVDVVNKVNSTVKIMPRTSYVALGKFQMNNYTCVYDENCAYVNKTVKYNGYGGSNTEAKIPNRAGLLAGIVDAEIEIIDAGGNSTTLTESKGDFKFTYPNERDENANYTNYPLPNEYFYIRIPSDSINLDESFTVNIRFKYMRVKANEIKKAMIYDTFPNDKNYQPLLSLAAGINTYEWTRTITIKNEVKTEVSIKVYGVAVEGGHETESEGTTAYKYGGQENKYMLPYKNSAGEMGIKSRASMSIDAKKENRFLAEIGDKISFFVVIKNEGNSAATLKNIKWTGTSEYFNTAKFYLKIDDKPQKEVTVGSDHLLDGGKGITLEKGQRYRYVVVATDTKQYDTKYKHLKVTIGSCENATLTNQYDYDFFFFKGYNVTLDKYIDKVNDKTVSISADKNEDSANSGSAEDDEDNDGDGDDSEKDEDIGNVDDDKNDESGIPGNEQTGKIYITKSIETEQIWIGENQQIVCNQMVDDSGQAVCYYDSGTGKYYISEMSEEYCIDITKYIKSDGRLYFDIAQYEAEVSLNKGEILGGIEMDTPTDEEIKDDSEEEKGDDKDDGSSSGGIVSDEDTEDAEGNITGSVSINGTVAARQKATDAAKESNPVPVKDKDIVEYKINVYNTTVGTSAWDVTSREKWPYYQPHDVYVNISDELPDCVDFSGSCTITYYEGNGSSSQKQISPNVMGTSMSFSRVRVPANGHTEISYKVTVNAEGKSNIIGKNTAKITDEVNSNNADISPKEQQNKSKTPLREANDYFKLGEVTQNVESGGDLYITKVQHATDAPGTKETFNGKTTSAYAEYGDKIDYAIEVKHKYEEKGIYEDWVQGEFKKLQKAEVVLRIDFPDDIHAEGGSCKVKINGQAKDVPVGQKDNYEYKYTLSVSSGKVGESKVTSQGTYDYTEIVGCESVDRSISKETVIDRTLTVNDKITVELVTEGKNKGTQYDLSATIEKVTYFFNEKHREYNDPVTHTHWYPIPGFGAFPVYGCTRTWLFNKYTTEETETVDSPNKLIGTAVYTINDYNLFLDEYIYTYNAEMAKYNNANGFTTGDYEGFVNGKKDCPSSSPLLLEKYETLTFATKVTNKAEGEEETDTGSPGKYKTRVRPTIVKQTIAKGLEIQEIKIYIDGFGFVSASDVKYTRNGNDITYEWVNNDKILDPDKSIIYYVTVKVMESNMSLEKLKTESKLDKVTNVNHKRRIALGNTSTKHDRYVPDESNISTQKKDEDYVKLKDLVIAGNVWIDQNRDGNKDSSEAGKADLTVILYNANGTSVARTTTKSNGFYTFGRQEKASGSTYYQYYVEFEYDGTTYKATEIYGGDNDGNADGKQNLASSGGSENWRQGHAGLPDVTSGSTRYMTDSNAYEFDDVRNAFDEKYTTIGFNKGYNSGTPLAYTKSGHESDLIENPTRVMKARSFIKQNYSSTVNSGDSNNTSKLFLFQYSGYSNKLPETEYLKFINLGLVTREEVDISLDADVHCLKTTINGEEMTYDYDLNQADSSSSNYNSQANAYKLDAAYNLDLYTSDYNYRYDTYYADENPVKNYKDVTSEMNADITYRIRITNNAFTNDEPNVRSGKDIPVETAINELAIYYDKNFKIADNTTTVTTKQKNASTGLLQDNVQRATRVFYGTEAQLNSGSGAPLTVNTSSKYGNKVPADYSALDYNVMYLTGMENKYLTEGESVFVEITLTIDKDASRALKITKDEDMGFELISEISAYTTRYASSYYHKGLSGKYAGLVDRDSNPGNLGLFGAEDYGNYEDDTYKVGIKVGLLDDPTSPTPSSPSLNDPKVPERRITGKVWDDARTNSVNDGNGVQYLGNGIYNISNTNNPNAATNPDVNYNNDKVVEGVKVSLIEVVQTAAIDSNGDSIYYEYPARYTYDVTNSSGAVLHHKGDKIEIRTNSAGEYTLDHFIPGYYKIRFDYGDEPSLDSNILYNGQDYKSTAFYNNNYYGSFSDYVGSFSNYSYFDMVKASLREAQKSDAQDDEIRRLNVNSYSETMTALQAVVFSEKQNNKQKLTNNTHMFAESTIFYAKPEELNSSVTHIKPSNYANFNTERLWNIRDLDFGIEYRPESSILLDKEITSLELITSDNKPLVKLYFKTDANGNRVIDTKESVGHENVQFMPNVEKEQQGFIYINMDTDELEGCTIKVEYEMTGTNNSEVDRINKNLDDIKYEVGANSYGVTYKIYTTHNAGAIDNIEYTYNANATAANLLASKYYANYGFASNGTEIYSYLKRVKKSYKDSGSGNTRIASVTLRGQEYFGTYLGQTYYTGRIGRDDTVAYLKIDHLLDYIDNDFTFSQSENSTKNRVWSTTTSQELRNRKLLNWNKVHHDNYQLIDKYGIRYDTNNKTNLAISVDDNKKGNADPNRNGNVSLSRFLNTRKANSDVNGYTAKISAIAMKILSADDISTGKGLSYENIAEVIQFTTPTGRRTTLPDSNGNGGVIGNANVSTGATGKNWNGYNKSEDDTDATEIITISPPTGLTE